MKNEKTFDVIIHEAEKSCYWAECPALNGCMTQGETLGEVEKNIKEAIELCLEEIVNRKETIPTQKKIYILPVAV